MSTSRKLVRALAVLGLGAVIGALAALWTPAHLDIAGSDARIRLHLGRAYDQIALSSSVLTGRRATSRAVLGEPVGVSVDLDLDPSTFVTPDGSFNADVIPAYVQTYSDPGQLAADLRWALTKHFLVGIGLGAGVAALVLLAGEGYRRSRRRVLAASGTHDRAAVRTLLEHAQATRRRAAVGAAVLVVIAAVPSCGNNTPAAPTITPSALLAGTPFAGTQVGGLLRPALTTIRDYLDRYISTTDAYYDGLRDAVLAAADADQVRLPADPSVTNLIFVTDRHCNIGMDRVIVALAKHLDIHLLVSGGDDAFSGSFSFESACTQNLATQSQQAGMTDVFVSGNHDSALTRKAELDQHIAVLDGSPVTAAGLTFVGLPDPRTSRYGQGIRPASVEAQHRLLRIQGTAAGRIACGVDGPVVVVLHDPMAGQQAVRSGCGKVTLALDGHTHAQAGPDVLGTAADGVAVAQFVGASAGGAPGDGAIERNFASRLTVGPLNHDASISIVSVDRDTGALRQVTVVHMTPEQGVSIEILPAQQ